MLNRCFAVSLIVIAGCNTLPGTQPDPVPDSVLEACALFPEENIPESIAAIDQDREAGITREVSFAAFENGCAGLFADPITVQECITCGEAMYDHVYGE